MLLFTGPNQAATTQATGRAGGTCTESHTDLFGYPSYSIGYLFIHGYHELSSIPLNLESNMDFP